MEGKLTKKELRRFYKYDPETGFFTRKIINKIGPKCKPKETNRVLVLTENGLEEKIKYVTLSIHGKQYTAHRLAFLYMEGYLPENTVDHINGIKDDNRWCNLREVSTKCNLRNKGPRKGNKTGICGVYQSKNKETFVVSICGKILGRTKTLEQAAKLRWRAEKKLNWPNCQTNSTAKMFLDNLSKS